MKYFANCRTLDELKAEYRRQARANHPDMGGDTATMQAINNAYEEAFEALKHKHNADADEYHQTTETAAEFIGIINALVKLAGLEIELCGSWLWIGGNTREHKDELKAAGCRWSANKKLWYWHHPEDGRSRSRGKASMNDIRHKYGSQVFHGHTESSNNERLGA